MSVPASFFARPAPRLIRWYANLPFAGDPVDQCDLRRRALFTTFLGVVLLGMVGCIAWVAILLGLGMGPWMSKHWPQVVMGVGSAAALALLILSAGIGIKRLQPWLQRNSAQSAARAQQQALDEERRYWERMALLSAGQARGRQSVALRFRALKAKVCRPYAR